MPICPNCGNQAADNALFCDQCGTKLAIAEPEPEQEAIIETPAGGVPEGVLICPDCGAENVPGELFCDVCGNPLEAPMPVSEPVVEGEIIEAEVVVETVAERELYCPTCGAEIHADDTFCGNCGAALGEILVEEEIVPIEPVIEAVEGAEQPAEQVVVEEVVVEEVVVEEEPLEQVVAEVISTEEAPVAEALVAEEAVVEEAVAEGELNCPVCGAETVAGQAFCASCGAALELAKAAPEPQIEVAPVVEATTGPYIEIVDSGAHIPLIDQPELLVGRVDEISGIYPDVDMTPHSGEEAGVSRRHARLIHEGDAWYVIDLDSTNGTFLNDSELQPKVRTPLNDGDRLSLGELEIVFHTD